MHPNADVTIQDPDGMTGVYPCVECRRETTHAVLAIVNSTHSNGYVDFKDHFLTVRCQGCGTVSFSHVSSCSEEEEIDERGRPCLTRHRVHYPGIATATDAVEQPFVEEQRIQAIRRLTATGVDTTKVIQLLLELNCAYAHRCFLSCIFLIRAILDHVPPIFDLKKFSEVANNYIGGGGRSFGQHMQHLENSSRKLADSYLHQQVRQKESLPTQSQVEFRADIDALLGEIIRVLAQP